LYYLLLFSSWVQLRTLSAIKSEEKKESERRVLGRSPRNVTLGAQLVGLLCRGYLRKAVERRVVELSRLGRNALGAPSRSGSRRLMKNALYATPYT
jgi:hypothetical protein